jgi:hypothetical protein
MAMPQLVTYELKKVQQRFELASATAEVFQQLVVVNCSGTSGCSPVFPFTAGSTSVVRLQSAVRERCRDLYDAVVEGDEFCGTFQAFLASVVRLHLFFYDDVDSCTYPSLRVLYSPHEQRCSAFSKETAAPWDAGVADYWSTRFLPVDLTLLARVVVDDFKQAPGGNIIGAPQEPSCTKQFRQLVQAVISRCEAQHPFVALISKIRLKDSSCQVLRQVLSVVQSPPQQNLFRCPLLDPKLIVMAKTAASAERDDSLQRLVVHLLHDIE